MLTQVDVFGALPASPPGLSLPIRDILGVNPIQIRGIDGLGPEKADIITSPTGSLDGELYSGSSVGSRNIVMKLGLNPNWADQTIESLRTELYKYFMPRLGVYLQFTGTHFATCQILGYVESMDPNIFSKDPEIQVSIICPRPDFVAIEESVVTGIVAPDPDLVDIDYQGNIATGFNLQVLSSVANPEYTGLYTAEILVFDTVTQRFQINATVDPTTLLSIGSVPGDKFALEVPDSGDSYSVLSDAVDPYDWMTLYPGVQQFRVTTIETGMTWRLSYFDRYGAL